MEIGFKRRKSLAWLFVLVCLVFLSLYLAVERIFQVDEVQFAFQARLLATGRKDLLLFGAPTILLGPLTWLAGAAPDGVKVLVWLRLPFVALMWANALLMVKGAGFRLRSGTGLRALLLAATLAPLWDYGFEIRHDVVLVTGVLCLWNLYRAERLPDWLRFAVTGALITFLQFVAFKAFLFTLPLLAIGMVQAHRRQQKGWLQVVVLTLLGLAMGMALGRTVHAAAGTWPIFWGTQGASASVAAHVERFPPWDCLGRLMTESPLLTCAALVGMLLPFLGMGRVRLRLLMEAEALPEWAYAGASLLMLLANPTPFPYNLLHMVPAMYLLVMRYRQPFLAVVGTVPAQGRRLLLGSLLLLHGLPWASATYRHLEMDNSRQCDLIRLTESLTDPNRHRVFDGAGLVSTREPASPHWLVHMFTIQRFSDGTWPTLRSELMANPTPVILASYRTAMLPKADQDFITGHYLALAGDFLVLGYSRVGGPFLWESLAEGRYALTATGPERVQTASVRVDGQELSTGIHEFSRGIHRIEAPPGCLVQVAWVGPHNPGMILPGPAPRPLFVNWY